MTAKGWAAGFLMVLPLLALPGCDVVRKIATPPTSAAQKAGEGAGTVPAEAAKATGSPADAARKAREAAEDIDRAAAEAQGAQGKSSPAEEPRKRGVLTSEKSPDGWVVEVLDVQRTRGDMLKVRYRFRNSSDKNLYLNGSGYQWERVYFFDPASKQQYHIAKAPDGAWMAGGGNVSVRPNGASELWASFPAPPATTRLMTLYLQHDVPPIEDVPIPGAAGGAP